MTESGIESSAKERKRRARRGTIRKFLIAVLVFLLIQSVTITLPIRARVVDAQSGKPVEGARVVALWSLDMATPHSYAPGGAVRIASVTTDAEGEFKLPLAFIVHLPVAPFSLLLRSDSSMPELIILADGYSLARDANDVYGLDGPAHDPGFLSLRHSSIHESGIKLSPLALKASFSDFELEAVMLSGAESDMWAAQSTCRRRLTCASESLAGALHTIKQRTEAVGKQRRERSREQGMFRR